MYDAENGHINFREVYFLCVYLAYVRSHFVCLFIFLPKPRNSLARAVTTLLPFPFNTTGHCCTQFATSFPLPKGQGVYCSKVQFVVAKLPLVLQM